MSHSSNKNAIRRLQGHECRQSRRWKGFTGTQRQSVTDRVTPAQCQSNHPRLSVIRLKYAARKTKKFREFVSRVHDTWILASCGDPLLLAWGCDHFGGCSPRFSLFVLFHQTTPRANPSLPTTIDRLHSLTRTDRSEEHTSELQSLRHLVC